MISYADALKLIERESFAAPPVEALPLERAIGRVLAQAVRADRDYPPFHRSQMDGFALCAQHFAPGKKFRIARTVYAGSDPGNLQSEHDACVRIMTGAALPYGCDAVVRLEDSQIYGESVEFRISSLMPGQFVSAKGEDLLKGQVALDAGTTITTANIMTLASLGIATPVVYKPLQVALVTTGDEVIGVGEDPLPWQIRNASAFTMAAFLRDFPVLITQVQHVRDDKHALAEALQQALGVDLVLVTGGVSAGDADYVPGVLQALGVQEILHRVAIKPGKPLYFGRKGETAVFGLPGNPVSTLVCLTVFVRQHLLQRMGQQQYQLFLPIATSRGKKHDLTEFLPARLLQDNARTSLSPLTLRSSGDIFGCARAHGLAVHEAARKNLAAGEIVAFIPFGAGFAQHGGHN